ncbi:MAG: ABC transporter substrate-binding protein [bacterium]|nr:ABC transporter substrate-binding protein [bacterium]
MRLFSAVLLSLIFLLGSTISVVGQSADVIEIAVALSLTGDGAAFATPALDGIQLAIDEANARDDSLEIRLTVYDDESSDERAAALAQEIVDSNAILVLGPTFSTSSLTAGPVYAEAGMVSLPPSATSDLITQNDTTFRVIFKNSDQGEMLATYLSRILGEQSASVIVVDSGYGVTLREGFERTAQQIGLEAAYYTLSPEASADDEQQIAEQIAASAPDEPVVFLTLDPEGARLLTALRRLGIEGPFLGGDTFGDRSFSQLLADLPEEQQQPGYFTDNLYGLAPVILDSANADTLAFAERFRQRYNRDSEWTSIAGYDAATLAIAAVRAMRSLPERPAEREGQRAAVLDYLQSLDSPERAQPGLLGPFWFDEENARPQAIRVGRFFQGDFESAPLQISLVSTPDALEMESGEVFELSPGRYGRVQRVVYTGVFINEISRVDLTQSTFTADLYVWLRFAGDAGPSSADPTDLSFPNMIDGSFDRERPAEIRRMEDGTEYWLWRIQGQFRNDFDLRRFPFDHQILELPFSNARATMESIVYVIDRRSSDLVGISGAGSSDVIADNAFRKLTQWNPLGSAARRENLVTDSSLGDPGRLGVESQRELSGFLTTVELERRTTATLTKTLLPLLVLTFIMFASLYFPVALVKEKVTVATTAALSGAVLLTAINNQLGSVGYTIAVEYIFYVFFFLSLLCIVSVLSMERLRAADHPALVKIIENGTRILFPVIVVGTMIVFGSVFG